MDAKERLDRASADAADWWVRLQSEELSRTEREGFIEWLRESHIHIAEMLRLAQVYGALQQFQRWANISTDGADLEGAVVPIASARSSSLSVEQGGEPSRSSRKIWLTSLAAGIAAVVVASVLMLQQLRGQVIATERGERREVVLEDGSVVQIDPQTRLRVKFERTARYIYLTQGRAVFHVAKNAQRPFLVRSDDTTVRAVGTAFGVERRDRDVVVVTVSEGKVAVLREDAALRKQRRDPGSLAGSVALEETNGVYLIANEQVTVEPARTTVPVRRVDSGRELAWAEGRLIFKDDEVARVVAEFNRYNRVQLQVIDDALASRPVSGVFDAADPEAFLAFIQGATAVRIERTEEGLILISSALPR